LSAGLLSEREASTRFSSISLRVLLLPLIRLRAVLQVVSYVKDTFFENKTKS
jgi:hypothetical protein